MLWVCSCDLLEVLCKIVLQVFDELLVVCTFLCCCELQVFVLIFGPPRLCVQVLIYSAGLVFRVCLIQVTCAWNLGCRCEVAWIGDQDEGLFLEICS